MLVAANDGVGTKLKIAIEAGMHDTIGIDLVAMCVNDLVVQGRRAAVLPRLFRHRQARPGPGRRDRRGHRRGLPQAGCALIGGETAEMPGMYHGGDYDLAGFAVGAAERGQLLPTDDIVEGDVLLGLASSGVHSNGFSLVRRIVAAVRPGLAATRRRSPLERPLGRGAARADPHLRQAGARRRSAAPHGIKALAHITGGGFPDNIPRVLPADFAAELDLAAIEVPPVFSWLAEAGGVAAAEMMRTFNCGIGMVLVVASGQAAQVAAVLQKAGEAVTPIGAHRAAAGAPASSIGARSAMTRRASAPRS